MRNVNGIILAQEFVIVKASLSIDMREIIIIEDEFRRFVNGNE